MKDTKSKLLQTAAKMFAAHGLKGVSTRDLAAAAGVNLCSINYYFGTKQKLYQAVMEKVSNSILENFVRPAQDSVVQSGCLSPREELKLLLGNFFEFLSSDKISETDAELLIKELLNPSAAYEKFYTIVFEPLHQHLSKLIALDLHLTDNEIKAPLLAHTLLGQVVMFRIHKEALLRRLGIKRYTPELLMQIRELLLQNCDAVLDKAKEA